MPGTVPAASNLPKSLTYTIVPPPHSQIASNILILLHSLGDTHESFAALAAHLALPETLCISLRAPNYMPLNLPGFQWGADILLTSTGTLSLDAKFTNAGTKSLARLVDTLTELGWKPREISFFGWGQGGMCALDFLASRLDTEFGGLVSVGGPIGSETKVEVKDGKKGVTPVILLGGNRKSLVTKEAEEKLKNCFKDVEVVRWKREGDAMMKDKDEVTPIMKWVFLSWFFDL